MKQHLSNLLLLGALLLAGSCTRLERGLVLSEANLVSVSVALRVGNTMPAGGATRGDAAVITEMDQTFRGITGMTLVPFDVRRPVVADDLPIYYPSFLSDITADYFARAFYGGSTYASGLVLYNNAHLYPSSEAYLPWGMASVLIYGHPPVVPATNTVEQNHLNGALATTGLEIRSDLRSASGITFSPVPIWDGSIPSESSAIVYALNNIVSQVDVTYPYYYSENGVWKNGSVTLSWNGSIKDVRLREMYDRMTNDGHLTSSSGVIVEYLISSIYRFLKNDYVSTEDTPYEHVMSTRNYPAMTEMDATKPLTYAMLYNGIRDEIVRRVEALRSEGVLLIDNDGNVSFHNPAASRYPGSYGLPDGAAVIRWNGISFETVTLPLDGVAPIGTFCYPPDLWYFANTTISTSTENREQVYTQENPSWKNDILSTYRSGKVVRSETRAAALDSSMQYSCAMLLCSVRAGADKLDDAVGLSTTQVSAIGENLPLTGVIIGSQRVLTYDFTPSGTTDYCLYDNCIDDVYLYKTSLETAPSFRTLVSQTPDGQPVYFCLEFRNDTGTAFTGADGLVLPGAKFYLVGAIELPQDDSFACVFERDHVTRINCLVSSLADARIGIPDLGRQPTLSVGLKVNINWIEATPTYFILY